MALHLLPSGGIYILLLNNNIIIKIGRKKFKLNQNSSFNGKLVRSVQLPRFQISTLVCSRGVW